MNHVDHRALVLPSFLLDPFFLCYMEMNENLQVNDALSVCSSLFLVFAPRFKELCIGTSLLEKSLLSWGLLQLILQLSNLDVLEDCCNHAYCYCF